MNTKFAVYEFLLGAYLAMDFDTRHDAELWRDRRKANHPEESYAIVSYVPLADAHYPQL